MRLIGIQAKGFKSFADKTNIIFPDGITGIVGPNGCGKSNISDAIKWVFGEQSAKNLRGKSMEDVIFVGSQNRNATNYAEVSLLFDNKDRRLSLEFDQIEITRRLYRGKGANEYYINKESVRLKDVQNLTMDAGLGKGSLALISQGTVSSFAEAKAEDRRQIFEEAANVSKYKKRKTESINKLERTQINLERIGDIVFELEKQYKPLKKQAEKAKKYLKIKNELQDKEITLIVNDISIIEQKTNQIQKITNNKVLQLETLEESLNVKEAVAKNKKNLIHTIDLKINQLQTESIELSDKISQAEKLQNIISYQKNAIIESTNKEERIIQLKENIPSLNQEILTNKEQLSKQLEEIKMLNQNNQDNNKLLDEVDELINENKTKLNKLSIKYEVTSNNLRRNSHLPYGVKSIIDAKENFPGIIGLVQDTIKPYKGYELAIAAAIGKQKDSIITKTTDAAKKALLFLKENKSGRATLLPLNNVRTKSIPDDAIIAAETVERYIGRAIDFVSYQSLIIPATKFILGNVLITENITSAIEVSKVTNKRFRVTTLDGQVINFGGSISGGHSSAMKSSSNLEKQLNLIQEQIDTHKTQNTSLETKLSKLKFNNEKINIDFRTQNSKKEKLLNVISNQEARLTLWIEEHKQLTGLEFVFTTNQNSKIIKEYRNYSNRLSSSKDEIKELNSQKLTLLNEWKILDESLAYKKKEVRGIESIISNNRIEISKDEIRLDNFLHTLNVDYQLTFGFAKDKYNDFSDVEAYREIVKELRDEIQKLGYVNIDAISQLKEIEGRYHQMKDQFEELTNAKESILSVIDDMDTKMLTDFDSTFKQINLYFQETFAKLFGGGTAKLEYTDPNNILESGIEVKAQPPGKSITNLSLFSGGEKSLISLAVLFAILKAKPIPLCVLDEAEAPLDQVNIERFAQYLHTFAANTQFIVITHRPGTMQRCDNLYGITMQEQGVSKLVSVDMRETEAFVEHN